MASLVSSQIRPNRVQNMKNLFKVCENLWPDERNDDMSCFTESITERQTDACIFSPPFQIQERYFICSEVTALVQNTNVKKHHHKTTTASNSLTYTYK